jgi:hypothetical protein
VKEVPHENSWKAAGARSNFGIIFGCTLVSNKKQETGWKVTCL